MDFLEHLIILHIRFTNRRRVAFKLLHVYVIVVELWVNFWTLEGGGLELRHATWMSYFNLDLKC